MVMMTLSGSLAIQGGGATAKPAAPASQQGPATTGRDAQRIDARELRDQIREQVPRKPRDRRPMFKFTSRPFRLRPSTFSQFGRETGT